MKKMCLNQSDQNKKGGFKQEQQKNTIEKVDMLYNDKNKIMELFDNYSTIPSEIKYKKI